MAALSDYLESGLLHHVFRGQSFPKPDTICIALTSGTPLDSHTGATIPEMASGDGVTSTNYSRVDLGSPASMGNTRWSYRIEDHDAGGDPEYASGVIRNSGQIIFNTALTDWGWISGIAITDHATVGSGNLLMHAELTNPRLIYTGDNVKFDIDTLEISFK
jgi:hypothetical protein